MITLSGFADEISTDLEKQLDVMASEGISHIELRGVWGKNVMHLSQDEFHHINNRLREREFKVSSIGSPVGKAKITEDFADQIALLKRAIRIAQFFKAPYIRLFSFYIPEGENPANYRNEVLSRLKQFSTIAEQEGIVLLHENEKRIYGDVASRCQDIMSACDSPYLRCAFDPANFIQCQVKPMTDAYPQLEPYVSYIHVKDAMLASGQVVPPGDGDGELMELVHALKKRNFSGYASLEPHLARADTPVEERPALFLTAIRAFKKLLDEAELPYN